MLPSGVITEPLPSILSQHMRAYPQHMLQVKLCCMWQSVHLTYIFTICPVSWPPSVEPSWRMPFHPQPGTGRPAACHSKKCLNMSSLSWVSSVWGWPSTLPRSRSSSSSWMSRGWVHQDVLLFQYASTLCRNMFSLLCLVLYINGVCQPALQEVPASGQEIVLHITPSQNRTFLSFYLGFCSHEANKL